MRHPHVLLMVCLLAASACGDGLRETGAGRVARACQGNADCEESEFCATNFCGGIGECQERPTMCDDNILLVCGCDGKTYQNECFARLDGVRLAANLTCVCGDNNECVDGQYCALDNSCENRGECLDRPESCDPDPQVVCGCDGMTYENACIAAQAGVRVSALGACDCATNDDCSPDQYCDALVCDGPGNCQSRTQSCTPDDPEVIGCDGVRYENACEAAADGVRVRPEG